MIKIDEGFLNDIGLGDMPQEQKKPFLQHIYNELELRVGTELSKGLDANQLQQFEAIIDRKEPIIDDWLDKNKPDYVDDDKFQKIMQVAGDKLIAKSEYVASKWLELNRPDYKEIVEKTLEDLKEEIKKNRDSILKD